MSTFTYKQDYQTPKTVEPQVSVIKFGDGYEQRQAKGLNTMPQKHNLKFTNRDETEANGIEAFFIARAGVESFDWTPPDNNTALKFVCRSWQKTPETGVSWSITATFDQVFEP